MNVVKYWRRDYYKRTYYKLSVWPQPVITSNGVIGGDSFACDQSNFYTESNGAKQEAWRMFSEGTADEWQVNTISTSTWYWAKFYNPAAIKISSITVRNSTGTYSIKDYQLEVSNDGVNWTILVSGTNTNTTTDASWNISIAEANQGYYKYFKLSVKGRTTSAFMVCRLGVAAMYYADNGTSEDYDFYEDETGTEADYTYYTDLLVNPGEPYTYTTEIDAGNLIRGQTFMFGVNTFGKYIFVAPTNLADAGGDLPDDKINYLPGIHAVIAYNQDGTKTAIFGAGSEREAIESLNFELVETGCGKVEINFKRLPLSAELNYRQRIDIHLFNDSRPWYSGYIISRPVEGTTEDTFKFIGHGYYNLLDKVLIFKTYQNMEVASIVADIAKQIEKNVGLTYNSEKIINAAYMITRIEFDGVTAKEALNQLADFAIDYVYGVDAYRQLYFKPRNNEINEQARFWVGVHVSSYLPTWDVEKIVNRAHIKGGSVDEEGEQWLAMVEDTASQAEYGIQEAVWSLPSAYEASDAERWGLNQIDKYKEPVKSAKVQDVILEYPRPDGSFFVRKLSTQGQAAITDLDGNRQDYPITKLKYTISGKDGIKLNMELGEQPFAIDKYFANLDRDAKIAELLQAASTKQLKTGG